MKTIAAVSLTLALLAGPALAADAQEDLLFHWGECAAVGALYENATDDSGGDPRIQAAIDAFKALEPRMELHTNALADAVGEARANAVQSKLLESYDSDIVLWGDSQDRDGFLIATWGETMDRCLREAATLPAAALPKT